MTELPLADQQRSLAARFPYFPLPLFAVEFIDVSAYASKHLLPTLNGLNRPGRPTKRTKKLVAQLLESIERGAPFNISCAAAGVDQTTFNDWRRSDSAFALQVEQALAKGALARLKKIEQHGDNDFRPLAWMLERQFPKEFSQAETQIAVGVGVQAGSSIEGQSFEILVVSDAQFLGLAKAPNYEHHPDKARVRDVDARVVPEELSGHLTRAGSPATSMILSQSEADAIEAQASRSREAVAKMFERYRPRQAGNVNG
jgi:hypothetical protein